MGLYLVVFAAAGAWSVLPDDPRSPLLERVTEAVVFLVLSFGMLLFLLDRPVPGNSATWLVVTIIASVAELVVVLSDRHRTTRAELVVARNPAAMSRLFLVNDLVVAVFFLPAVVVNVWHALA